MSDPTGNDPKPEMKPDDVLAPFLAAATKASLQDISDDLLARILADAAAVTSPTAAPRWGFADWLAEIRDGLGGWGALAGLGTAMVAGLWIGGVDPDWATGLSVTGAQSTGSDLVLEEDLEILFPSYDSLLGET